MVAGAVTDVADRATTRDPLDHPTGTETHALSPDRVSVGRGTNDEQRISLGMPLTKEVGANASRR